VRLLILCSGDIGYINIVRVIEVHRCSRTGKRRVSSPVKLTGELTGGRT
jgi:hypothetical protein